MARRAAGRGRRRVVPGVRDALLYRCRSFDRAFCLRPFRQECMWCSDIAALEAGRPREFTGDRIWSAIAGNDALARAHRDLMRDTTSYRIVGPDSIEAEKVLWPGIAAAGRRRHDR